jgi:hypothetical protein
MTTASHVGALAVACPQCCSPVGVSCASSGGTRPARATHQARVRAWVRVESVPVPASRYALATSLLRRAALALDPDELDVSPGDVREQILAFLGGRL